MNPMYQQVQPPPAWAPPPVPQFNDVPYQGPQRANELGRIFAWHIKTTCFTLVDAPDVAELAQFVERVDNTIRPGENVIFYSLYILDHVFREQIYRDLQWFGSKTRQGLWLSAVMLAHKYWDDKRYKDITWVRFAKWPVHELSAMMNELYVAVAVKRHLGIIDITPQTIVNYRTDVQSRWTHYQLHGTSSATRPSRSHTVPAPQPASAALAPMHMPQQFGQQGHSSYQQSTSTFVPPPPDQAAYHAYASGSGSAPQAYAPGSSHHARGQVHYASRSQGMEAAPQPLGYGHNMGGSHSGMGAAPYPLLAQPGHAPSSGMAVVPGAGGYAQPVASGSRTDPYAQYYDPAGGVAGTPGPSGHAQHSTSNRSRRRVKTDHGSPSAHASSSKRSRRDG
ncbi:hypothetical protein K466DRAFT_605321 [Polyporus arcularius HHB13444]|uniref:Cyclin N-terminal domain-containing protein n=1 Tax=Polyporus arcularius HHB13444 TaxID=1314778 RepID=A0A5C3P3W1_9APHY|nr:hypothetical protein K466DRAFT_605321 [Polyporus arcularius HHB13444]